MKSYLLKLKDRHKDIPTQQYPTEMSKAKRTAFEQMEPGTEETCVRKMDEVARAHPPAAPFHEAALAHHRAVERFGRLPERNRVLGRDSTKEEEAWLKVHPTA